MKVLLFVLLSLPIFAADLPPELARPAAAYQASLDAADAAKATARAPLNATYEAALAAGEKSTLSTRGLKPMNAIAVEREAIKTGEFPTEAPADLPKTVLVARKNYLAALQRVEAEAKARRARASADYLKELVALQGRPTTNATLSAQIEAEKKRVLEGTAAGAAALSKTLQGTKWHEPVRKGVFTLHPDGSITNNGGMKGTWKLVTETDFELHWDGREPQRWRLDADAKTLRRDSPTEGKFEYKRE